LERTFDEGDIRLGTLFANQAAVAIENARLYEETDRRLRESTTLQEISRLVNSSLQPEQIFQTLVETVASAFGYHFVAIYTLEGEELTLGAQAGYDPAAVYHVIPLNEGVNGRVARRGQAELIRDVSQDPDFLEAAPEIVSEICVPIKKNDLVLGTLSVESTASEPLTEADLDLVSAISHQVSVAIQNAKLYEETRKRLGELSIVYQASIAATSTLDFAEIMERIAEVLQRTLGSTLLTLLLYDEDTQRLRIRAGAGYPPEVVEHIQPRLGEGITGSVALSGEPLNVPDVRGDARYVTSDETVRSELCVPLQVGDRIIGVLDVQSTRLAAFSDDDLRLASTLAGQLSLIIENARLYEETKKRLEELSTLHETSVAATSTMDLAEIFERAVGALQRSLGFSNLTLMLHDEDEQRLKIVAAIGYPPEVAAKVQPKVGEGITGWVASTGEPLCLPDVTKDPRYIAGDERIRSELCVPLEVGDKIIGVLNVESPDLAAFSDDDARLLSTLAGQLAVIIENARLFESLGESEERFRGIFENVMLGLYRTTPDGRILMANPALVRMLGYPSFEELAQRDLEEKRYQPEYPRSDFKRRIESEGQVVGLQSAWKRYDGTTLFIRESARAIRDEAGNTLYYEGTVEDITEQKRAEEDLQQSYHRLQRALEETVNALASMAEKRDPYTAGHQQGVAQLAVAIAKRMSLSQEQIEGIRVAAIVHDIGKIYVPAEILSKPGPLTDREFDMIRFHPQAGHDVLKTIEFPWPVGHIVLQHHEKMDGSGYPQGLSGEEILLEARILAVADVVVAMAAHRPWREARGIHEALQEIRQNRGVSYDPDVVDACLRVFVDDWSELM
jgi:PAS domain S-box-containing protein